MIISIGNFEKTVETPLVRADVEKLLKKVKDSSKLNLEGRNLRSIDLSHLDLTNANLSNADLREATLNNTILVRTNLSNAFLVEATLNDADLSEANLSLANLTIADLSRATMSRANISSALMTEANLTEVNLVGVKLNKAILFKADLSRANLAEADLREANLTEAILTNANLNGIVLANTNLSGAYISARSEEDILRGFGIKISRPPLIEPDNPFIIRIRITEQPLRTLTIATILAALSQLYTQCWLIQQGRFADFIKYAQTHDLRFEEEAELVIAKISYNSPAIIDLLVSPLSIASAISLMMALKSAIDAVVQIRLRYKEKELEISKKSIDVEKYRLEALLEEANKLVDQLHPGIDSQTRAMLIQPLLLTLSQSFKEKGLELALPKPKA